ncbi:FHDC1 [Cordylochernes scorpioides]|uniref:FHDC1 n=1 Tax=Cordylochernes scorpioides TaxID=51811 RepID=A0ABY6LFB8_9ARAC|nr:FHDC1 [Cordylochernes scorpioides]
MEEGSAEEESRCPANYHYQKGMCYKDLIKEEDVGIVDGEGPTSLSASKLCKLLANPSMVANPATYDSMVELAKKHHIQCGTSKLKLEEEEPKVEQQQGAATKECSTLARWSNINHQERGCGASSDDIQCNLSCDMKLCVKKSQAAVTVTCHMGQMRKFAFTFSPGLHRLVGRSDVRLSWHRLVGSSTHPEASRHVYSSPQMSPDSVLPHTGMLFLAPAIWQRGQLESTPFPQLFSGILALSSMLQYGYRSIHLRRRWNCHALLPALDLLKNDRRARAGHLPPSWTRLRHLPTATVMYNTGTHSVTDRTLPKLNELSCALNQHNSIFERDDEQLKCKLLQEFHTYKFDKNVDLVANISNLRNLAFKLNNLKQNFDDNIVISKILTILPEEYNYFCTAWESTGKDEKTIENLISRLTTEEIRRNRQSQPEDRVAMNATKQKNNSKPAAKVNKEQCRICKKFNHKEKDCYFRNKEKQPPIAFIAEQREEFDKRSSVTFIVDSGSTCHMINEEKLLDHQKKCDVNINVAKKEEGMRAKTSGQFKGRQCNLNEVIFVPELSKNLLSVSSIVNNGGEVNFKGDKVTILKDGKKVLEGDQLENGLYAVNIEQHFSKQNDSNLTLPSENKTQEWHRKLGHIGMQNLRKLESLVDGMELNKLEKLENDVCEICIMAKQTRKSFGNERSRATRPLEIVHTDLCGPIEPLTHDNKKYIMTFLDDYTHFCYVYLLSNKYETKEYIKEYVDEVERFLNAKVSKLRCDNGGEYANTQVKEWCKMKGIILDFTIPYTPQLNGKAERLNRTLIEKTRALLLDSKFNKEMWGEATRVAAYLINRSPSNTVQTTPVQMWFGRKPNLSNVKLFGSEVYVKKLGNLKKLDSKNEKYSLIGYIGNGYRLWDKQKRRIIIARDVVFTGKLTNEMTSVIQPRYREDLDSEIEESQDTKMELDTHDKPQNSTNSKYMLRNRENISRPERLKDYEVLNSVSGEIGLLTYNEAVTGVDKENWIKDGGHYKARLVARGNEQKGLDFDETFSPVVSTISLRMLLSLSVKKNLKFKTFDVKTAFLYGYLDEEIFMYLPEGYEDNKICRLKKALYGLRQAPSKWNKRFEAFLKTKGLVKSKLENCIFKNQNGSLILALYVDDGMLFGSDEEEMDNLLVELAQEFEIRISNNPEMFVGMNIMNKDEGLILSQHDYIECVLKKYNMLDAKPVTTPIVEGAVKIDPILENKSEANKTRPDVAYAVGYESRLMHEPTNQDIQNVKRTMRYLKQTKTFGLHYSKQDEDMELNAYCDSDFAGDMKTRKSTSGYTILFGKGPISWSSRKQPIVALSTTEAEYIAAAECVKELIYIKALIEELTNETILAKLNIDNQSSWLVVELVFCLKMVMSATISLWLSHRHAGVWLGAGESELFYGGWVAPNIYYLGSAGVIKVGELRIAGLSGIYNGGHYLKGHFEFFPFNESTKRSVYHVRNLEVFRLKQLNEPVDIMLTHDWPRGIYNYGDVQKLLRHKGFFQKEIEENTLGSRPAEDLLKKLKPDYWFSAHLHCKFAALVKHDSENTTRFLALDKCLPRRNFLQILDIPKMTSTTLQYDPEWLSILKQTDHLLNIERCNTFMPGPGCNDRWDFTPTKEELEEINTLFSNNFKIPENFEATVEYYTPEKSFNDFTYTASVSSQTTEFCNKLNIVDPLALLLKGAKTSCPNFDIVEEKETDVTNVSQQTYNPDEISIMSNEDQDDTEDFDVSFVIDKVGNRPIETSSNISQDNPSSPKRSLEESPCTTDRVKLVENGPLTVKICDDLTLIVGQLSFGIKWLIEENLLGSHRADNLDEAVVLRGTVTPLLRLTTRTIRRTLERPRLATLPIAQLLYRWQDFVNIPFTVGWPSLRRCAFSGHNADIAVQLALHTLPHPVHPTSARETCIACGSSDLTLAHRYWSCSSISPLIREAFNIIQQPPDLQGWLFGQGLDDDALVILASAKSSIQYCFILSLFL